MLADPGNPSTQVAMECAKEMGCKASIVDFVMPLGTTVNMNGTALYEATTVIFLAQVRRSAETVHPHVACASRTPSIFRIRSGQTALQITSPG